MRILKLLVLALIALALIVVSMANREAMVLKLLPDELAVLLGLNYELTLPGFIVLLGAMLIGVFLGFVWEWIREHKHRAAAVSEKKERMRLEREVKKTAPQSRGDDVLAILDGN